MGNPYLEEDNPYLDDDMPQKKGIIDRVKGYGRGIVNNAKDYYDYLHTPTEPAPFLSNEWFGRVLPESLSKTTVGALEFLPRTAVDLSEGAGKALNLLTRGKPAEAFKQGMEPVANLSEGIKQFVGKPTGFYGFEPFKEAWESDPVGSAMAVAPVVKPALSLTRRGIRRAKEPARSVEPQPKPVEEVNPYLEEVPIKEEVKPKATIEEPVKANPYLEDVPDFEPPKSAIPEKVAPETLPVESAEKFSTIANEWQKRMAIANIEGKKVDPVKLMEEVKAEVESTPPAPLAAEPVKAVDAKSGGSFKPETIADETVNLSPLFQALDDIKASGGLSYDALAKDYGKAQMIELMRKRPGLISKKGKATLDTVADTYGFPGGDELLQEILGAKSKKSITKDLKTQFEDTHYDDIRLAKKGFTKTDGIYPETLDTGDKVLIKGESFTVKGFSSDGSVILKDGETLFVDPFKKLDAEGIKRKAPKAEKPKPEETEELPGMGFKDTFDLTFEGAGDVYKGPLPEKAPAPKQESLLPEFAVGAKRAGTVETGSAIVQLTESLDQVSSPKQSLMDRVNIGQSLAASKATAKTALADSWEKVKGTTAALWDAYKNPPKFTTYDKLFGDYDYTLQKAGIESHRFGKALEKAIPDKLRREGIVNYMMAGGDTGIISKWAKDTKANPKTRHLFSGYDIAGKLTDSERLLAENIRGYFDSRLEAAMQAGMVDHGLENYVSLLLKKDSPLAKQIKSEINAGLLNRDPFFTKKRFYETYFEAEQAGEIPKNKDIGYIVTTYDKAFNGALAARSYIKNLSEAQATDGRPLVHIAGYAKELPVDAQTPEAYLIKPKGKPEEFGDYRKPPDHSAFRNWKWIGKDTNGSPIMLEGEMYIHPEIYSKLKNAFAKSAIKEFSTPESWGKLGGLQPGRAVLSGIHTLKGTLLSLSGFHQVQEGVHAVFHKVNPARVPEIDIENPQTSRLVKSGMMLYDYEGSNMFAEGLTSGGLITKVPGIGGFLQKYGDYLFKDYIPRLKNQMAHEALERNIKRYGGKISDDQIYKLTANQANAAFGEMNYKAMGRNPTLQDAARLAFLAPDFLEARVRFTGQAMKPFGQEQFMALAVRGALGMYVGSRIVNSILNDGDAKWDKPFSVIINGREFTLRAIPGDIYHLLHDPQNFIYWRLNPTTVRTMVEYATKRDARGQYRDAGEQVQDFVTTHIPIPLQQKEGRKWWESVLQSMGVNVFEERSQFAKAAMDLKSKRSVYTLTPLEKEHHKLLNRYADEYKNAKDNSEAKAKLAAKLKQDILDKKVYPEDIEGIYQRAFGDRTEFNLKHMELEDVLSIWGKASPAEKDKYKPLLIDKIVNLAMAHPIKYEKMKDEIKKAVNE